MWNAFAMENLNVCIREMNFRWGETNESEKENGKNGNSILVFGTWNSLNHALSLSVLDTFFLSFIRMKMICLRGSVNDTYVRGSGVGGEELVAKATIKRGKLQDSKMCSIWIAKAHIMI